LLRATVARNALPLRIAARVARSLTPNLEDSAQLHLEILGRRGGEQACE